MDVSKHAVILEEFEECTRPSELVFDRLRAWSKVVNLPHNLRNDTWGLAQIDKHVTTDVKKPLRRWVCD